MPQLVSRVADHAVLVSGRQATGQRQELPPRRVAQIPATITIDQAREPGSLGLRSPEFSLRKQTPDGRHSDIGYSYRPLSGPSFQVITDIPPPA
jgi:hypothetical protein